MKQPIYKQIYEDYKKYIMLGVYKPNDKLPSVREVSSKLGINPNTVNRAFLMLEEDGYIETIFKKGSYVKNLNLVDEKSKHIYKIIEELKFTGFSRKDLENIIKKVYGDKHD